MIYLLCLRLRSVNNTVPIAGTSGRWILQETVQEQRNNTSRFIAARFDGQRPFSTAIYFLLEGNQFSAFHRIKSDECWHFYAGVGIAHLCIVS